MREARRGRSAGQEAPARQPPWHGDRLDDSDIDARINAGSGAARARGMAGSVAASAALGFLVGAVFWHFVGFWDFVRAVVLKGPEPEASQVAQTGPACTALVLDRTAATVRVTTCPNDAAWLAEPGLTGRADLLMPQRPTAAKRWSVTVQAETASE